jgi:hypothetical protein
MADPSSASTKALAFQDHRSRRPKEIFGPLVTNHADSRSAWYVGAHNPTKQAFTKNRGGAMTTNKNNLFSKALSTLAAVGILIFFSAACAKAGQFSRL